MKGTDPATRALLLQRWLRVHTPTVVGVGAIAAVTVAAIVATQPNVPAQDFVTSAAGDIVPAAPAVTEEGRAVTSGPLHATTHQRGPGNGVVVHVVGSVNQPGVHALAQGSRVTDALHAAGGIWSTADVDALNLARELRDGERIAVPDLADRHAADEVAQAAALGVDVNTATISELETLTGVGPALAQRIVSARAQRPFVTTDDLLDVPGIGPSKLAGLLDQLAPL